MRLGLEDGRLHHQDDGTALRLQRLALGGPHQAAHAGQAMDAAGGLQPNKRELAVGDEQRRGVRAWRIFDARSRLKMQTGQMGFAGAGGALWRTTLLTTFPWVMR